MAEHYVGVRDAKIGSWTSTGTYGTAYDLYGIRSVSVNRTVDTATLEGDDIRLATRQKGIAVEVQVEFVDEGGQNSANVMSVLTGGAITSDGSGEYVVTMDEDDTDSGPFGLTCKAKSSDNPDHEIMLFFPKLTVTSGPNTTLGLNGWKLYSLTASGVADSTYGTHQVYTNTTAYTLTLPPS